MPQCVEGTSENGERPFAEQTTFEVACGVGAARAGVIRERAKARVRPRPIVF